MDTHELINLRRERIVHGRTYLEFLRKGSLSAGLYVLRAGEVDPQQPHLEDEVYVAMRGRARFTAGDVVREVHEGDVIYVAAGVPHRFHDITAELELIVVFAPPESAPADAATG
jgi:mannose-6-phosphate isomerase-like protein (cupin superfamily)